MPSRADLGLTDGNLDHVLVFWESGDTRRAVVPFDYSLSRDYLDWLLRRYGWASFAQNLSGNLTTLNESSSVLPMLPGGHVLGLMRPDVLGDPGAVEQAHPPFLIAYHRDTVPDYPIMAASRAEAVALVRRLHLELGIDKAHWRGYECERFTGILDRLVLNIRAGRQLDSFKTELERELFFTVHPPKKRRQAVA